MRFNPRPRSKFEQLKILVEQPEDRASPQDLLPDPNQIEAVPQQQQAVHFQNQCQTHLALRQRNMKDDQTTDQEPLDVRKQESEKYPKGI